MVMLQEPSEGRKSSITSIASDNPNQSILLAQRESTQQGSDVPLKVRKPYTISKQREKWTEDEHQRFIEAIKLYGRAWPQIEEYVGTKTAVQIRSHAQKYFSKVMKEGSGKKEKEIVPIEIPPPRPKRKPLHPYPRKFVPTPNKSSTLCLSFHEVRKSTDLKTMESESHSPTSVLASEGTQSSTSHAKDVASGNAFSMSSGSKSSHAVETCIVKENSTLRKENEMERSFSLTLNLCRTKVDVSTNTKHAKEFKDMDFCNNNEEYSMTKIKLAPVKTIKLFGHTLVTSSPLEYSDTNLVTHNDQETEPLVSKRTQTISPIPQLTLSLNGRPVSDNITTEEGSNVISTSGMNCSFIIKKVEKPETKQAYVHYTTEFKHGLKIYKREFLPYKRCSSNGEVATLKNHKDDRSSNQQHIYL